MDDSVFIAMEMIEAERDEIRKQMETMTKLKRVPYKKEGSSHESKPSFKFGSHLQEVI
jgi:hypothetical protein